RHPPIAIAADQKRALFTSTGWSASARRPCAARNEFSQTYKECSAATLAAGQLAGAADCVAVKPGGRGTHPDSVTASAQAAMDPMTRRTCTSNPQSAAPTKV
ncbi:MAG TPA: hypothetical protein VN636_06015, partial [Acidimicrobiia bacterium]|nr:hypothetical protein [Acidimicrobiia bacterium]